MLLTTLSACGGDPPAPEAQPRRTPTSASSSPSPTPPALPAAAKENTRAGAKAFVRHYVDLINYAQATGSLSRLRAIEARSCESCKNGRRYLAGVYESGGKIRGGAWRIRRLRVQPDSRLGGAWNARLVVRFGPQTITRIHPTKTQRLRGGTLPLNMTVVHFLRGWKVLQWTRER